MVYITFVYLVHQPIMDCKFKQALGKKTNMYLDFGSVLHLNDDTLSVRKERHVASEKCIAMIT